MKGRETKGPPSADLLVCFPSRAHLTLMPKPICSPARPSEPNKRHHKHHHNQYLKKSSFRSGIGTASSPLLWAKTKQISSGEISAEPTSPKVTCAGQIKVRHKASAACKNWQSVMEEIERIHNKSKHRKKSGWIESFGFKKDVMQFLTCLRNIRFDFRCFGAFPQSDIISDDEEDEEEEEEEYHHKNINKQHVGVDGCDHDGEGSRTVFSKWFMVLQEDQNSSTSCREEIKKEKSGDSVEAPPVPPPNALLLMRCRSAPAKSWLEEKQEEEEDNENEEEEEEEEEDEDRKGKEKRGKNLRALIEEEKRNSKKEQNLVVMRYDTDFYKISTDIAKETWVVGGITDPFSRSRSWKR